MVLNSGESSFVEKNHRSQNGIVNQVDAVTIDPGDANNSAEVGRLFLHLPLAKVTRDDACRKQGKEAKAEFVRRECAGQDSGHKPNHRVDSHQRQRLPTQIGVRDRGTKSPTEAKKER